MTEADKGQVPARSKRSIESLKAEAYGLLKEFQTAASAEGATEVQRVNAETAKIVVDTAEMGSTFMDRGVGESQMSEMEKYGEQLFQTLDEDVRAAIPMLGTGSEVASIVPLLSEALKQLEEKREELKIALDQHAWAAWDKACDELSALRAGRSVTKRPGAS